MKGIINLNKRNWIKFDKISDLYIKYAGKWHEIGCCFPFIDNAVCNCNLAKNKKVVKDLIESF